jgi:hypothetical protein
MPPKASTEERKHKRKSMEKREKAESTEKRKTTKSKKKVCYVDGCEEESVTHCGKCNACCCVDHYIRQVDGGSRCIECYGSKDEPVGCGVKTRDTQNDATPESKDEENSDEDERVVDEKEKGLVHHPCPCEGTDYHPGPCLGHWTDSKGKRVKIRGDACTYCEEDITCDYPWKCDECKASYHPECAQHVEGLLVEVDGDNVLLCDSKVEGQASKCRVIYQAKYWKNKADKLFPSEPKEEKHKEKKRNEKKEKTEELHATANAFFDNIMEYEEAGAGASLSVALIKRLARRFTAVRSLLRDPPTIGLHVE